MICARCEREVPGLKKHKCPKGVTCDWNKQPLCRKCTEEVKDEHYEDCNEIQS
jgi:hypothetical protein